MSGHSQIVLDSDVETLIARPTNIERLTLDRARRHIDKLLEHAQLDGIGERIIDEHRTRDERKRKITRVDGEALANLVMQAWLATPELGLVGDIVMNERSGVEMLDGRTGSTRHVIVTADCLACEHADERAMPLARIVRELGKRPVEVAPHVRMRALAKELRHVAIEGCRLLVQEFLEDMIDHGVTHASAVTRRHLPPLLLARP